MTFHVRDTCRLCDAPLPDERVLDLGETPLANALLTKQSAEFLALADRGSPNPLVRSCYDREFTAPLYLKQCVTCGHVQLPVVVDPKLLFPADYPYQSATGAAMREHLERLAADLIAYVPHGALVVEIGSNDGYLLKCFRHHGLRAVGVDPALTLATSATERGDLTVPTFFNRQTAWAVRHACGQAQLVTALNVFAHADDLHEIVEGVKVLLAPDGRFVFEVGYLPDVLRTNNFGTVYHEHLTYWTVTVLEWWLRTKCDLHMYDAQHIDTQGGSIRCFVRRGAQPAERPALDDPWATPYSSRMLEFVRDEPVTAGPEVLAGWQSDVERRKNVFSMHMQLLKHQGKSIAGYGCSAKSTTLLHLTDIGRETIDFICDDAPTKQGKFSPGKHIPIVPGSWLEEKQPDYCVSLSGNFSEAFRAAHPLYRGEWIEPDLGGA